MSSRSSVLVSTSQRGNPVLQHIRNVNWEYSNIVPDYVAGTSTGILYLSLKFHALHPEYIHTRISKLGQMYTLRILLLHCDVADSENPIREITKICLVNNITVMTAWSAQQCGRYISLYLTLDNKPPDSLKEKTATDYMSTLTNTLTTIKGINKTDVLTLVSNFGSFHNIVTAPPEKLSMCPGFGDIKVRRVKEAFNIPFKAGMKNQSSQSQIPNENNQTNNDNSESNDDGQVITVLENQVQNHNSQDLNNKTGKNKEVDRSEGGQLMENSDKQKEIIEQQLQINEDENIDLLDSDEEALNEVAANFGK